MWCKVLLLFRQKEVNLESTPRSINVKHCEHIVLKSGTGKSANMGLTYSMKYSGMS